MPRRFFLVGRSGVDAVIREVTVGSCHHSLNRPEAWSLAKKMAAARKKSRPAKAVGRILFIDLDGSQSELENNVD